MSFFTVLIITQCLVLSYVTSNPTFIQRFNQRFKQKFKHRFNQTSSPIIDGRDIGIDKVPYQLSVRINERHICGAALISPKYALSAAHCFDEPARYTVKGGSRYRDIDGYGTKLKTVILHPKRAYVQDDYDIAILELLDPLPLNKNSIWPIRLPDNDKRLIPGVRGLISGFGDTVNKAYKGSKFLRAAEVVVENKQWCQMLYIPDLILHSTNIFCAGARGGHQDACQGDSGGPFAIDNVLYGLVSAGLDCGDPSHPGLYTSVPEFREYIRLNTGI